MTPSTTHTSSSTSVDLERLSDSEFAALYTSTTHIPHGRRANALACRRLHDEAVRRWDAQEEAETNERCAFAFYGTGLCQMDAGAPDPLASRLRARRRTAGSRHGRGGTAGVRCRRSPPHPSPRNGTIARRLGGEPQLLVC